PCAAEDAERQDCPTGRPCPRAGQGSGCPLLPGKPGRARRDRPRRGLRRLSALKNKLYKPESKKSCRKAHDSPRKGILFQDRVMGVAQALTAIVLSLAAPAAAVPQNTDSSALQAVASSCSGATTPTGGLPAMFCGVNV